MPNRPFDMPNQWRPVAQPVKLLFIVIIHKYWQMSLLQLCTYWEQQHSSGPPKLKNLPNCRIPKLSRVLQALRDLLNHTGPPKPYRTSQALLDLPIPAGPPKSPRTSNSPGPPKTCRTSQTLQELPNFLEPPTLQNIPISAGPP